MYHRRLGVEEGGGPEYCTSPRTSKLFDWWDQKFKLKNVPGGWPEQQQMDRGFL